MFTTAMYAVYLALSLAVTVWVAHTLHRSGRVFLVDAFDGNTPLADSVNRLLVVGFYLINVGYVALALRTASPPASLQQSIEVLSAKIGIVLLILGALHFGNLVIFSWIRRHGMRRGPAAPIAPAAA